MDLFFRIFLQQSGISCQDERKYSLISCRVRGNLSSYKPCRLTNNESNRCIESNCHGYATGKSFYISGDGMDIVLEDDYIELSGEDITDATFRTKPTGGGSPLHSEKITWESGKIKVTYEKHMASPVYKMVYSPPIEPDSGWRYWKPE